MYEADFTFLVLEFPILGDPVFTYAYMLMYAYAFYDIDTAVFICTQNKNYSSISLKKRGRNFQVPICIYPLT